MNSVQLMVLNMTHSSGYPKVTTTQHGQSVGFSFVRNLVLSGWVGLFLVPALVLPVDHANAASSKQIMKECRKRYGSSIKSWHRNKKGKIICVHGGTKNGSKSCSRRTLDSLKIHQERIDFCRRCVKLGPLQLRKRHGKWWCVWSD